MYKVLKFALFLSLVASSALATAQTGTGGLQGQVTDPSGAEIPKAKVILTPPAGAPINGATSAQGNFEFKSLSPGTYVLNVLADGFNTFEKDDVLITADQVVKLNVSMTIAVAEQKVQVTDSGATIDVNPANNAGAIVISGKELEALPDDPDELLADLQALAGPSTGPNGGQLYIDGFTAGQLPPKASIREIRVNQNPFSAEFDKVGYGRIEVFTKPGTDKYHGQINISGNTAAFNSPNPFAGDEPPYHSELISGDIGGPLGKKASFFFNVQRRNIDEIAPVNATILDTNFNPVPFAESVPNPQGRTNISPRLDYAVTKNNTLTARYQFYRDSQTNDGVGGFSLLSQAYNSLSTEHTVQISDTQIFGAKIVNETRFQYLRDNSSQSPQSLLPSINVLGGFNGGGNGSGVANNSSDHYEFQNYTSVVHGNNIFKFGGRLREVRDSSNSAAGFNGTFTFAQLAGACPAPGMLQPIYSYQCAEQQLQAGLTATATQLSITTGSPLAAASNFDAGLYFQDDWRVRPNITISPGMRYEVQTNVRDRSDWAPRLGIAWGVGGRNGPPKVVLRGGFGIFYDRLAVDQVLQADRLNGVTEQKFVIPNANCFPTPTACSLSGAQSSSVIYRVDPDLRAPYVVQAAGSVERQLTKNATLSATYLNAHGFNQLLSLSLPNPSGGRIYQYSSEGVFRQNQLIVNTNVRAGTKVQLFGYYTLNYANGDTAGVSSFPSDSTNISADYGRASFDVRHRVFLGGSIALPHSFRLSPFMVASSGSPFNITTPSDLNGDTIFNDRPAFMPSTKTCSDLNIYCTPLGNFDANPGPGERIIPINYATGPAHVGLNLRLSKTIGFGPKVASAAGGGPGGGRGGGPGGGGGGGGGRGGPIFGGGMVGGVPTGGSDHRYNLTFAAAARNVFNHVNTINPTGVLGSPNFDTPNGILGFPYSTSSSNRRIDLQVTFAF